MQLLRQTILETVYLLFWKLFTLQLQHSSLKRLEKKVFYSCLRTLKLNRLAYVGILQKIEYVHYVSLRLAKYNKYTSTHRGINKMPPPITLYNYGIQGMAYKK